MSPASEAAFSLLEKARGDWLVCDKLLKDSTVPVWIVGFHAQQAVEKSLKAVLSASRIEYPHTHNLTMLIELLRKHDLDLPEDVSEMARLTPFGAALRYDEMSPEENLSLDKEWVKSCVSKIIAWAESRLGSNQIHK